MGKTNRLNSSHINYISTSALYVHYFNKHWKNIKVFIKTVLHL